jgi:two-component system response regulator
MNQAREMDILLVEDNEDDAAMTLRALRKANFVNGIRVARDGAEALDILFGKQPDGPLPAANLPRLIVLDLKLPKIDGLQVLQRIKNDPRTRATPVVILTSSQEQRDVVESYGLGVNSYIVKPVNFESFVEAVCNLGMYWLLLNHPPD